MTKMVLIRSEVMMKQTLVLIFHYYILLICSSYVNCVSGQSTKNEIQYLDGLLSRKFEQFSIELNDDTILQIVVQFIRQALDTLMSDESAGDFEQTHNRFDDTQLAILVYHNRKGLIDLLADLDQICGLEETDVENAKLQCSNQRAFLELEDLPKITHGKLNSYLSICLQKFRDKCLVDFTQRLEDYTQIHEEMNEFINRAVDFIKKQKHEDEWQRIISIEAIRNTTMHTYEWETLRRLKVPHFGVEYQVQGVKINQLKSLTELCVDPVISSSWDSDSLSLSLVSAKARKWIEFKQLCRRLGTNYALAKSTLRPQ